MLNWIKFFLLFIFSIPTSSYGINVIVTVPYVQDLIQNTTCFNSKYKVRSLISVGIDPHTYTLTPHDRILLKKADLIIQVGSNLEPWFDKIKTDQSKNIVILSSGLTDPHIWHSPWHTKNAIHILNKYFTQLDPFEKNNLNYCANKYINKINTTVKQLQQKISALPKNNRTLATNHDSLGYFAEDFGFKIYSVLGLSDEEAPSAMQLKNIITLLKQNKIKALFLESTGNNKSIETIAKDAKIKIGGKLFGDSFGEKNSGADTTLGVWQSNVSTILKALK